MPTALLSGAEPTGTHPRAEI